MEACLLIFKETDGVSNISIVIVVELFRGGPTGGVGVSGVNVSPTQERV